MITIELVIPIMFQEPMLYTQCTQCNTSRCLFVDDVIILNTSQYSTEISKPFHIAYVARAVGHKLMYGEYSNKVFE